MFDSILVPIAREGRPFIAAFVVATIILGLIAEWLLVPAGILTVWCILFFRDPDRVTPTRDGLVISPADGLIVSVAPASWPKELGTGEGGEVTRIGIFMNVFDVHVNRTPVDGRITKLVYVPGAYFNASFDKASEHNERQIVAMETRDGRPLVFVQIAGLVARRIVCRINEGQTMLAGERMGMIRFGSRVDVYLPAGVAPLAVEGQRCVAGETVLADLASVEPARNGAVR